METGICNLCEEPFPLDELRSVGSQLLCEDCFQCNTFECSRCGESILSDDNAGTDSYPLCAACRNEFYTFCRRCDTLIRLDEAYYIGADDCGPFCEYCYSAEEREREEDETYIHEYSYKPDPIFYGSGNRFFGIELEIDGAGKSQSAAKAMLEIANRDKELLYIKGDGSLDNGIELVSHPATLSYHLHGFPWSDILDCAVNLHYRSHQTSTCGLHVHVNKDSFGKDTDEQDDSISRVLYFVESHWLELLNFSRRTERALNRWCARYGYKESCKEIMDHAKKLENGRYSCVNLCNTSTIEFRIFRGTLRLNTLLASIELVDQICKLADVLDDEEIKKLSWSEFVRGIDGKAKSELIEYLKIRRLYINEPVASEEDL